MTRRARPNPKNPEEMAKVRESAIVAAAQLLGGPQVPSGGAPESGTIPAASEGRAGRLPPAPSDPADGDARHRRETSPYGAEQGRRRLAPSAWRAAMHMGFGAGCGIVFVLALLAYSDAPVGRPAEGPEAGRAVAPVAQMAEIAAAGAGAQREGPSTADGAASARGPRPGTGAPGALDKTVAGASGVALISQPAPTEAEPVADDEIPPAVTTAAADAHGDAGSAPTTAGLPDPVAAVGPAPSEAPRALDAMPEAATSAARGAAGGTAALDQRSGGLSLPVAAVLPTVSAATQAREERSGAAVFDSDPMDPRTGGYAVPAPAATDPADAEADLTLSRSDRLIIQRRLMLARTGLRMIDGIFGPRTRAAITAWQDSAGLPATGYLDETSLAQLEQATERDYRTWQIASRQSRREREPAALAARGESGAPADSCPRDASGKIAYGEGVRCDFRGLRENLQEIFR